MSKLVDKERLAKLAKALDQRAKAAVKAEEERALQAEAQVLEDAKADASAKDEVLAGRIATLEGLVVGGEGEGLEAVIGDVAQNKADIEELKEFKEAHDHAEMEGAIDGLEQAIADMDAAYKAADAQGLADAKAYADEKIAALVNSAPEAMDTLQELAKAIADNKDVYDAYIAEHAQAMANMKAELQAEIDADVKAEADRALEQEAAIREEFAAADAALKAELQGEMAEAVAGVHKHDNKEVLDGINADKVAAWDAAQANAEAKAAELDAAMKLELQAEIDADVKVVADDLALEKAKIVALQEFQAGHKDFDDSELKGRLDALEAFQEEHDHAEMEQGIADNKAAIEKEVEDRNAAIEEAVKDFATDEEVKAMLGNVVSSLALEIVDNKVQLSLGGVDGIAIAEVELDMANDDDIDEIIAGLDEE